MHEGRAYYMNNVVTYDRDATITEIRNILIKRAKIDKPITYKNLTRSLKTIRLQPNDPDLFKFLDTISRSENRDGRGMLSVMVIHTDDDKLPGDGFFKLAIELGREFNNREQFWKEEKDRVYNYWKGHQ